MTLAIAHEARPDNRIIIDAVREMRPPFSPTGVVDEFAALLKAYDVTKVVGDHYGGEFVKEPFHKHGISYELCKQPKSDLYRDLLPGLNSGQIVLPRHDRLVAQICGLERRTGRSGKDSIDHAPNVLPEGTTCQAQQLLTDPDDRRIPDDKRQAAELIELDGGEPEPRLRRLASYVEWLQVAGSECQSSTPGQHTGGRRPRTR
jgi:hypothetical protein